MGKKGTIISLSLIVFVIVVAAFAMLLSKINKLEKQIDTLNNTENTISGQNELQKPSFSPSAKPTIEGEKEVMGYDLSSLSADGIVSEIDRLLSVDTEGLKPEEIAAVFPIKPRAGSGYGSSYAFTWSGTDCIETVRYSSEFNMDGTLTKASKAEIVFWIYEYERAEEIFRTFAAEYFMVRNQKGFSFQSSCEGTSWYIEDARHKSRDSLWLTKDGERYRFSISRDNSTFIDPKSLYGDAARYDLSLLSADDVFSEVKRIANPNLRGKNLEAFLASPPFSVKGNRTDSSFEQYGKMPNLHFGYTFRGSINDSIKYVNYEFLKDDNGNITGNYSVGISIRLYQFDKAEKLFDLIVDEYFKDALIVEKFDKGMIAHRESRIEGFDDDYTGAKRVDFVEVRLEKDEYSGKEAYSISMSRSFCAE